MVNAPKDEPFEDVMIFSNEDEKLKSLGKTLNNDYSRNLLKLLRNAEMTANEIAKKTGMSLPLVIHHLNIMSHGGIVVVARIKFNSKNQPMKCYTVKSGVLILPEKAAQKARESKSLSIALKRVMRFAGIGIAGVVSWMAVRTYQVPPTKIDDTVESDIIITLDGALSHITGTLAGVYSTESIVISLAVPAVVVTAGIILERVLSKRFGKKEKRGTS